MDYNSERALILLSDLERMTHGRGPLVELVAQTGKQPAITGKCTRSGLLRLAIHLARAAFRADATVIVSEAGRVGSDVPGGVMEFWLADEQPPVCVPPQVQSPWMGLLPIVVFVLSVVGLVSVVRLILGLLA